MWSSPVQKFPSQCPVGALTLHVGFKSTAQIIFWLLGLFSIHKVLISPMSPAREKACLIWHQVLPLVPHDWMPSSQCHRVMTVRGCQAWGNESTRSRPIRGRAIHGAGAVAVHVPSHHPMGRDHRPLTDCYQVKSSGPCLGPSLARHSASEGKLSFIHLG